MSTAPDLDLRSVRDFIRYATTRFTKADLAYGHGTTSAWEDALFLVLESLRLPLDQTEIFLDAKLLPEERALLAARIEARVTTRKPSPYLTNSVWFQGLRFYVNEHVLVPRSFIAELLTGEDGFPLIEDFSSVNNVLDLCTGSGCLAILAADLFPQAKVDAVDLSPEALAVARRNVDEHDAADRVTLYQGDLFAPLEGKRYNLIITNPPYVDAEGMATLPPEYRHEPTLALQAGDDGLDILRRILAQAAAHLHQDGALLCEVGRCRTTLEKAFPRLPFLWLDTATSHGEVFWLKRRDLAKL